MNNELKLLQFIASHLKNGERTMLLVVAESSGSSPGRAGYKMAVGEDGELAGSIGGGVMEVELVELAKVKSKKAKGKTGAETIEQVHRKNVPNASGMICSGRQTVIMRMLTSGDIDAIDAAIAAIEDGGSAFLTITDSGFGVGPTEIVLHSSTILFERLSDTEFTYSEKLGARNELYIIGGGHCALALSEVMSRLGFAIRIFDDRAELNTLEKNNFADEITVIDTYDEIGGHIPNGSNIYVVVMTLGYASDAVVIRQLVSRDLKYFGVLGSKAKMATLMKELLQEGFSPKKLELIRTPIGLPIKSRTPEEIAVSIAAEIIAIKNENND